MHQQKIDEKNRYVTNLCQNYAQTAKNEKNMRKIAKKLGLSAF